MNFYSSVILLLTMTLELLKPQRESFDDLKSIPNLMHTCLFYGPKDIRYEKVETPKIKDDEILVKVKAALTCGTDLKTYERGHPVLIKSTPSSFGHQFSGIVADVGRNVNSFKINQRVVAVNTAPCFECTFCKKEKFSLCENIEFLNGAYAEYVAIPERIVKYNTYEIPTGIDFEQAALLESLSVVLHGVDRSGIKKNKTVCIIGTGSIGLLFAALSKHKGAKVISIGRNNFKLQIAKELGADHILNVSEIDDLEKCIKDLTDGVGPEIVIEAVGVPETWELATRLVTRGGLVNFFGGCKRGTKIEIDTYRLHYDELNLIGVFHHTPKCVHAALELLKDTSFSDMLVKKIITHTINLSQLEKAFLLHQLGKAIQVAVKP